MNSDLTFLFNSISSPLHLSFMEDGFDIWGFIHLKLWLVIFCSFCFHKLNFLKSWAKFEKYWEKHMTKSSLEIAYFGSFWGSVATKRKLSWPIEGAKGLNFPELRIFKRECSVSCCLSSVFIFINKRLKEFFGKLQIKLFAQFRLKTKVGSNSLPEFAERN